MEQRGGNIMDKGCNEAERGRGGCTAGWRTVEVQAASFSHASSVLVHRTDNGGDDKKVRGKESRSCPIGRSGHLKVPSKKRQEA